MDGSLFVRERVLRRSRCSTTIRTFSEDFVQILRIQRDQIRAFDMIPRASRQMSDKTSCRSEGGTQMSRQITYLGAVSPWLQCSRLSTNLPTAVGSDCPVLLERLRQELIPHLLDIFFFFSESRPKRLRSPLRNCSSWCDLGLLSRHLKADANRQSVASHNHAQSYQSHQSVGTCWRPRQCFNSMLCPNLAGNLSLSSRGNVDKDQCPTAQRQDRSMKAASAYCNISNLSQGSPGPLGLVDCRIEKRVAS
jgi:hypothetical protein